MKELKLRKWRNNEEKIDLIRSLMYTPEASQLSPLPERAVGR